MQDFCRRKIDYLRVSVTDHCNLRCRYCMPRGGLPAAPRPELLTDAEIVRACRCAAGIGVEKLRLTGGEPLLRENLPVLLRELKSIPGIRETAVTTNGILLSEQADALASAGLDCVNVSLDTPDPAEFARITGSPALERVMRGLERARESGIRCKVNCLPVRELNGNDYWQVARLAKNAPVDVRFIELMPLGQGTSFSPVYADEIRLRLQKEFGPLTPVKEKRGNGPAVYYSLPGFRGKIGLIGALSHNFCAQCNRIRLTSTGFLKLCLDFSLGLDVRRLLRDGADDAEITERMRQAVARKPEHHLFAARDVRFMETHGMSQIGG